MYRGRIAPRLNGSFVPCSSPCFFSSNHLYLICIFRQLLASGSLSTASLLFLPPVFFFSKKNALEKKKTKSLRKEGGHSRGKARLFKLVLSASPPLLRLCSSPRSLLLPPLSLEKGRGALNASGISVCQCPAGPAWAFLELLMLLLPLHGCATPGRERCWAVFFFFFKLKM